MPRRYTKRVTPTKGSPSGLCTVCGGPRPDARACSPYCVTCRAQRSAETKQRARRKLSNTFGSINWSPERLLELAREPLDCDQYAQTVAVDETAMARHDARIRALADDCRRQRTCCHSGYVWATGEER